MKDCRLFILVMSVELYEFVILEYFCSIIYDFGLFKILVGWLIQPNMHMDMASEKTASEKHSTVWHYRYNLSTESQMFNFFFCPNAEFQGSANTKEVRVITLCQKHWNTSFSISEHN